MEIQIPKLSKHFTVSTMQLFVKTCVQAIKANMNQPVSLGVHLLYTLEEVLHFWNFEGLDFYDVHWYNCATPIFDPS